MFGYSLMIDLYNCKPGTANDLELCYRFLEELVSVIKMTKQGPPHVFHGPTGQTGLELYPEKAGVSAWIALIESGVQIHTIAPKNFVSIDIYTCGQLDQDKTLSFCLETFGATDFDINFLERGARYQ